MDIDRATAMNFVAHFIDDAGEDHQLKRMEPVELVRFVGWRNASGTPWFIAIRSHLGLELSDEKAEQLAAEYVAEIGWFAGVVPPADYIL